MKKIIAVFVAAALAFSLVACGSSEETTAEATDINYGNMTVKDIEGELLVTLEGNPTTGYEWTASTDNDKFIKISAPTYKADKNDDNLTGVGGTYSFVITPLGACEANVMFTYSRSWEEPVAPSKQLYIVVDEEFNITYTEIDLQSAQ